MNFSAVYDVAVCKEEMYQEEQGEESEIRDDFSKTKIKSCCRYITQCTVKIHKGTAPTAEVL